MNRKRNLIVILLATILLVAISCQAQSDQFARDYMRVTNLRESKRTDSFEQAARDIHDSWFPVDKQAYGRLMAHTLKSWVSACKRSDEPVPTGQIQKYAALVLSTYNPAKPDNIDIDTQFALVSILHEKYSYSKGKQSDEDWRLARRKGHARWLHVWRRLEKAIDKDWDSDDVPVENVPLPEGADGFAGMPPELIEDPGLRAAYEKAIRENQEKTRIRNEQLRLRSLKKRYAPILEKYLASMYSIAPFDNQELKQHLNAYGLDKKVEDRILRTVTANVERQSGQHEDKPSK